MTLGPAGPPLHKGVLEVPQSKQVLFWPSSDEPSFGFLRFMSSDSDPCTNTQNRSDQQLFRSKPHDWDQERKAPNLITELIVWIQHFAQLFWRSKTDPDEKNEWTKLGHHQFDQFDSTVTESGATQRKTLVVFPQKTEQSKQSERNRSIRCSEA